MPSRREGSLDASFVHLGTHRARSGGVGAAQAQAFAHEREHLEEDLAASIASEQLWATGGPQP